MQILLGILVICAMIYLLVKKYETRMVLFGTGMTLAFIAGDPMGPLVAFSKSMKQANIFEVIISSLGFAAVIKATGCDKHLIAIFVRILKKLGPLLILGVALATMVVNMSIPSAAGTSAAMGTILIPLLISAGIPAAVAAGAVLAGLYGGNLNPGHVHPTLVAELAQKTSMDFVSMVALPLVLSVIAAAIVLMITATWQKKKEQTAIVVEDGQENPMEAYESFKLNYFYAILPLFPLVILVLGSMQIVPILKMPVSHAMIIGSLVALIITRSKPSDITKSFFKGMGDSFGSVFGLIITANIFVAGMESLGLIKALLKIMTTSPEIAKLAAIFGPFMMAILSGSGEAAAVAFNTAVSVHASQFGLDTMHMGAMTVLSGGVGRSMSPVAGCMIICAGIAKVSPVDVIKSNAIAMFAALFVCTLFFMF